MTGESRPSRHEVNWASVELTPALPMSVFTSMEPWHPERIGALALYCSDGRWGEAFDDFCHKHVLIPRYDRWAVPGGPAWLASDQNDAFHQTARRQLDFLVRVHELERIIKTSLTSAAPTTGTAWKKGRRSACHPSAPTSAQPPTPCTTGTPISRSKVTSPCAMAGCCPFMSLRTERITVPFRAHGTSSGIFFLSRRARIALPRREE